MTGFDIIVLLIVAVAAIGGFMRGFVQEVLSLASWVLAVFAIRFLHTDLTAFLLDLIGTVSGAAVLAFAILLLIPYAGMKLIAWITTARTYPFVNASADAMVHLIDERQRRLRGEEVEEEAREAP